MQDSDTVAPPAVRGAPLRARLAAAARNPRFLLWALMLVGVALRLWMISVSPLDPRYSNADDGDYYRRALRLAVTGQYVDDAWLIRPPLHVFFFAIWLRLALLAGAPQLGVLFVQLAQTAVAALTVLVGAAVARLMFRSERAGLLFAAFLALWYQFVEQPDVLYSELIYIALFLAHLWLLLRFDARGRRVDLLLSGVALGSAALARSPALYALGLVWVWLAARWWRERPRQAAALIGRCAVVAAGCLAVVLPWTARNYIVYQRLIPVDTLGQVNLWLDLDRVADRARNQETLRGMPQADRAGYAMGQALTILRADPWRPFAGMWPTFQHIWKAQFVEDYFVKQSFFTRPLRETAWLGLPGDLLWAAFALAGFVGLAGPIREGAHWRLFALGWLAYSLLTVLVFHVEPRYLLPIWTLLALYGAGWLARLGLAALGPRPGWGWRAAQAGAALAFLALLLTYRDYPRIVAAGLARERAFTAAESAYRRDDYPAAERGFREALAAQPGFVDAQVGVALSLGAQGRYDEALAALDPGSSRRAGVAYGELAREAGRADEAAATLARYEPIAGEDIQAWALEWLRPPATARVAVGAGLDIGYVQGFFEAEADGGASYRWLSGSGRIVLPLPAPLRGGEEVVLRLAGGLPGATPLTVRVAGGPAQVVPVQGGQWRAYRLSVPPEAAGSRRLEIELSAPTFVPALLDPASQDARALSLRLGEVRVQ